MTDTSETDLSVTTVESTASPNPSTVEKLKTLQQESTQRSKRIFTILRTAFTQTMSELKDGRAVISPLAQEVTAETVATVKEKGQQAADTVSQTWRQAADKEDLTDRIIGFMRSLTKTTATTLLPVITTQATKLDGVLNERYGDRYANIKARFAAFHTGSAQ